MIQPFAQGERWTLYAGDCLAVLPHVGQVQAVVTDQPYSSGGQFRGDRTSGARSKYFGKESKQADRMGGFSGDNRDQRAYLLWSALWLGACLDVAAEGAPLVCFTDWRQLPTTTDALQAGGWVWRGLVSWTKPDARPQMGRFSNAGEYAAWGTKGPSPDSPAIGCLPGHYSMPTPRDKAHPTQKPTELMRALVRICPHEGRVLDPFAGSGSTGVGALLEGRFFVGIERDHRHLETASRRLAAAETAGVQQALVLEPCP